MVDPIAAGEEARARLRAIVISLVVSLLLLAAKYQAYRLTGSTAILSDALESIVNVMAAVFAIGALIFAGRPADRNHPYGHGKMEFLSAAFEGGLIAFASLVIVYEVVLSLLHGVELRVARSGPGHRARRGAREPGARLLPGARRPPLRLADPDRRRPARAGRLLHQRGHRGRPAAGPAHRIAWLDPVVAAVVALNLHVDRVSA